jgi:hypothetical protein
VTTPKKPKAYPEDSAKAVFRMTTRKPQDIVVSTNQLLENVKKHPQSGLYTAGWGARSSRAPSTPRALELQVSVATSSHAWFM